MRNVETYCAAWKSYGAPRMEDDVIDIEGPSQSQVDPGEGSAGADRAGAGAGADASVAASPAARTLDKAAMDLVNACYRALNGCLEGDGGTARDGTAPTAGVVRTDGEGSIDDDSLILGDGVAAPPNRAAGGASASSADQDRRAFLAFAPSAAYAFPREVVDTLTLVVRSADLHASAAAPAAAAGVLLELLRRAPPAWVAVNVGGNGHGREGGQAVAGEEEDEEEDEIEDEVEDEERPGRSTSGGGFHGASAAGLRSAGVGSLRSVSLVHHDGSFQFPPFAPPASVTVFSLGLGASDSADAALRLAAEPSASASERPEFLSPFKHLMLALRGAREVVAFAHCQAAPGEGAAEHSDEEGLRPGGGPATPPRRHRSATAGDKRSRRQVEAALGVLPSVRSRGTASARLERLRAHAPFARAVAEALRACAAEAGGEGAGSRDPGPPREVVPLVSSPALYFQYLCAILAADASARTAAWRLSGDVRPLLGSLLWRLWVDPGAGRDAQRTLVEGLAGLLGEAAEDRPEGVRPGSIGATPTKGLRKRAKNARGPDGPPASRRDGRGDAVADQPSEGDRVCERIFDSDGDGEETASFPLTGRAAPSPFAAALVPLPLPEDLVSSATRLLYDLVSMLSALEVSGAFDPRARLFTGASASAPASASASASGRSSSSRAALRGVWGTPRSDMDHLLCSVLWGWQGASPTSRPPPARTECAWPWATGTLLALPCPDRARLAAVCLSDRYAAARERGYIREEKRNGAIEALAEALAASRHNGAPPRLEGLAAVARSLTREVTWLSSYDLALTTSELVEVLLALCVQGDLGNGPDQWSTHAKDRRKVGLETHAIAATRATLEALETRPGTPSPSGIALDLHEALVKALENVAAWAIEEADGNADEADPAVVAGLVAARVGLGDGPTVANPQSAATARTGAGATNERR